MTKNKHNKMIILLVMISISICYHITCFAGPLSEFIEKLEAEMENRRKNYTAAEKEIVTLPDDSFSYCAEIEIYREYDTKKLCESYASSKIKTKNKCLADRIVGNETKEGIREIKNICDREGNSDGLKSVNWFIRKEKVKSFFK